MEYKRIKSNVYRTELSYFKKENGSNRIRSRQQKDMHWQVSLLIFFDPGILA